MSNEIITSAASSFSSAISTIDAVRQYGARFQVGISNLSVDHSSGLIYIHPERFIRGSLTKTETVYINYDRLPGGLRTFFEQGKGEDFGKTQFLKWVHDQVEAAKGHVFEPGDEILGLHKVGAIDVTFLRNTTVNQPLKIVSIKSPLTPIKGGFGLFKGEVMKMQLTMELDVTSQYWKLRNDGIKGTTVPVPFKFFLSANGTEEQVVSYDLLFPFEALKGRLAHLQLFSYANKGGAVSVKKGELYVNNTEKYPNPINLEKGDNEIYTWVKAETITYWVEYALAKVEYSLMLKSRGHIATSSDLVDDTTDMVLLSEHEDYVILREKTQILWGEMVCEVEISTPRENSGHSSLTLEMIAASTLQSKKLGESLNTHSVKYRKGVEGVIDMLLNKAPETAPTFRVDTASGRTALMKALGKVDDMNDGRLLSRMADVYPDGVVLEGHSQKGDRKCAMYFHPQTTRSMSTIIGGVAEGFAKDIAAMMIYMANPAESGVDQAVYSKLCVLRASMETWLSKAIQSQGILKRMGRSYPSAAAGSKVRTAANFAFLNHKEGELPKVALNSNCGVLKLLAKLPSGEINPDYCDKVERKGFKGRADGHVIEDSVTYALVFNSSKMNGAKIAASRSPMPMMTACELVLGEEVDAVLDVAHVLILPSVWGPSNEGDTDGDGIVLLNLDVHGLSLEDCLAMNKHPLGMVGYKVAYGNDPANWPIAEFCSYDEKWGKKAVHWGFLPEEKERAIVKKYPYITVLSAKKDEDSKRLVSSHYRGCVGTAYNICVVLTHKTLSAMASGENSVKLQMAMAIAWRLVYEGLGLGGYTPNSRKFFKLLSVGTFPGKAGFANAVYRLVSREATPDNPEWETDGGLQPDWVNDTTASGQKLPLVSEMVKLMELEHIKSAEAIVVELLSANRMAQDWKAIETAKQRTGNMDLVTQQEAMAYGAIRRALGQGWDPAGYSQLEAENTEEMDSESVMPRSLLRSVMTGDSLSEWVSGHLTCSWVRDALAMACRVHCKVENYIFAMNQDEDTDY